jgi:spore coat protein U-like protein
MKRTLVTITALAIVAIAAPMFAVGSDAKPLLVSASVANHCTITTLPVSFGAYDTVTGNALAGAGSVTVACTKGMTGLLITLDKGGNNAFVTVPNTRAMSDGSEYLNYDLYADSGHTVLWTDAGIGLADSTSKAPRTVPVYGLVAAGQDVAANTYNDSVLATILY